MNYNRITLSTLEWRGERSMLFQLSWWALFIINLILGRFLPPRAPAAQWREFWGLRLQSASSQRRETFLGFSMSGRVFHSLFVKLLCHPILAWRVIINEKTIIVPFLSEVPGILSCRLCARGAGFELICCMENQRWHSTRRLNRKKLFRLELLYRSALFGC